MIPRLRRKFISITAAALFVMLLTIMGTVNGIFIFQSSQALDSRLAMVMGKHGSGEMQPKDESLRAKEELPQAMPDDRRGSPHGAQDRLDGFFPGFEEKLHIPSDSCVISFYGDGTLKEIRQNTAEEYSETELLAIADEIRRKERETGWHQYFKFRMDSLTAPDASTETRIVLLNASSDLYAMGTVLLISVLIGIASYLLALLVIILASGRAVRPIAESYARQKQFVTDAGHELKTPLTVISADNELARMIYGDSEWFDSIDSQVARLKSLVSSLISLARMDEEEKNVFSAFNLSDAVYDTAKSFENLIHAKERLITFDIADGIAYVGDESRLRQVVSILMDNAVKYCDERGKIAVRLIPGKQIRLQFINDYANLADCSLGQLFERFYRGDRARTPDGSYGLGLAIAKSIVEQHNGTIQAKALEHGRILFEIALPRTSKNRARDTG